MLQQPLLYGMFGPAIRTVEAFNWVILKIGGFLQKGYFRMPNAVILFLMFCY